MIRIRDTLAGDRITFNCVESNSDLAEVAGFIKAHKALGIDTESTGLNPYATGWKLRTVQCGNAGTSYVVPAPWRKFVQWMMRQTVQWIGHNGPHDIRSIDVYLGYDTGIRCAETFIPAHHMDSRNRGEGGIGHGLKDLSVYLIDRNADKWEIELKKAFKEILIPMPGEVYKSGKRKGQPKFRKAKFSEGWSLIDPMHPAYIAYAAADPILTYRLFKRLQPTVREFYPTYQFDQRVAQACDKLQRRAMRLDVPYTLKLNQAFTRKAESLMAIAAEYGCQNIHSGQQVARTLIGLGVHLTERTAIGLYKVDDRVMRQVLSTVDKPDVQHFVRAVLGAKQVLKRRESYTEQMLVEVDANGRVHPSINILGARTTRMSISRPPLQQLPTKDRESELADG